MNKTDYKKIEYYLYNYSNIDKLKGTCFFDAKISEILWFYKSKIFSKAI